MRSALQLILLNFPIRNIGVLSKNNTVYAIDLLGLGASEKPPNFQYTMETWAEVPHPFQNLNNNETFRKRGDLNLLKFVSFLH